MHEVGLAQGVLGVALEAAGGAAVRRVWVRVGDLHAVDDASFRFAFQLVAEDTPAAGAAVDLEAVPVRLTCRGCGADRVAGIAASLCSACGSTEVAVAAGDELSVLGIQLEDGTWRFAPGEARTGSVPPAAARGDA